jgi:thioredoxin reductase (NADPH)
LISTGAQYRKLPLENLSKFEGAGVYYGATFVERQLCGGEEVIVVGGGNSAGQAAVFLAQTANRIHILVRSSSLASNMSRYLIRRIEGSPNIIVRPHTEIVALEGNNRLESVSWRNNQTGQTEQHNLRHIFVMTGADPNTGWFVSWISITFLREVAPEIICTLLVDIAKYLANRYINSLLAFPFSGLDVKKIVISLPLSEILPLGLNFTKTV